MATTSRLGPRLSATLAVLWRTLRRDMLDPYRPELHYMRGPGPRWRAKHGMIENTPVPPHAAALPA
jgi:hypothetical protein